VAVRPTATLLCRIPDFRTLRLMLGRDVMTCRSENFWLVSGSRHLIRRSGVTEASSDALDNPISQGTLACRDLSASEEIPVCMQIAAVGFSPRISLMCNGLCGRSEA